MFFLIESGEARNLLRLQALIELYLAGRICLSKTWADDDLYECEKNNIIILLDMTILYFQ